MQLSWPFLLPKINWTVNVKDRVVISVLGPGKVDAQVSSTSRKLLAEDLWRKDSVSGICHVLESLFL